MPTRLKKVGSLDPFEKNSNQQYGHKHRHIKTGKIKVSEDILGSRVKLFYNEDINISIANISKESCVWK